jgi:hypothetical protein
VKERGLASTRTVPLGFVLPSDKSNDKGPPDPGRLVGWWWNFAVPLRESVLIPCQLEKGFWEIPYRDIEAYLAANRTTTAGGK